MIKLYKRIVTPSTTIGMGMGIIIGASTRNEYLPIVLMGCLYIMFGLWVMNRRAIFNGENNVAE